jgi:hypothetical protein
MLSLCFETPCPTHKEGHKNLCTCSVSLATDKGQQLTLTQGKGTLVPIWWVAGCTPQLLRMLSAYTELPCLQMITTITAFIEVSKLSRWRDSVKFSQAYSHVKMLISSGSTKPLARPGDGEGVSPRDIGEPSYPDAAVCPTKLNWILIYVGFLMLCSECQI